MRKVYWVADSIYSPLGDTSEKNATAIFEGKTNISHIPALSLPNKSFFASLFSTTQRKKITIKSTENNTTFFEQLCISAIENLFQEHSKVNIEKTILILSTTKGNIELIGNKALRNRLELHNAASKINQQIGLKNTPIVVSNACISGIAAMVVAKRLIEKGVYEHAIVCGADCITDFVASGFQTLNATANDICKPYDKNRTGINLGEAACAVLLSSTYQSELCVLGGSISNDANHISGPSKTGEELAMAIKIALVESNIVVDDVAFVSAHGTATAYNDEMESKAFEIAGLSEVPIHSLKPQIGHTLGAAGLIESIVGVHALKLDIVPISLNFNELGVSGKVHVATQASTSSKKYFLKTASGFGGCNAAIVYSKI